MPIDALQKSTIEAAFGAAQQRTRAPIVCVLARASANYEFAPLLASGFLGLLTPWPLLMFTQLSAQRIFLAQLVVCFACERDLMLSRFRFLLTPRGAQRANAHRAALTQFQLRELDRIAERSGVLIYVSLAERYARVIACRIRRAGDRARPLAGLRRRARRRHPRARAGRGAERAPRRAAPMCLRRLFRRRARRLSIANIFM